MNETDPSEVHAIVGKILELIAKDVSCSDEILIAALATRAEILQEIGRELAKRRDVFPRWVREGRFTQKLADERINRMQAGYEWIMHNMPDDSPQKAMFK